MNRSQFMKNVLFGFGGQFVVIILGIIIPRVMITSYGSDVNGLISTVSQVFTYMALLEAGIGQAARNALYGPLTRGDRAGVSRVASVAQRYFRKITTYYAAGVLLLALVLPLILKTGVGAVTVFLVVLFEGMAGAVSFYFVETRTMILAADGRGYVNNGVNVVDKTLGYAARIVMALFGINIALLQFVYFLITVAKVFFYKLYFDKVYPWIDYTAAPKTEKLKDRHSYIVAEITWTIFSSTGMIVLSAFVSTKLASVYAVYNMVFGNLNVLLTAVYNSVNYMLGQTYSRSRELYIKVHDAFVSVFFGGMTTLMCISYILILPFIRLYTAGVTDVEYVNRLLPALFCLVQILSWARYVPGNLIGVAGYIKKATWVNITEAVLNLVLSVVLVFRFGIVGVILATVCALPLKMVYCNIMSDKVILKRPMRRTVAIIAVNLLLFVLTVGVNECIDLPIHSYWDFIVYGCLVTIVVGGVGLGVNVAVNPDCMKYVMSIFSRKDSGK